MTTDQTLVIVGASLAGAKAAEGARAAGFDGRVVLIGDEHELPYERPPLSKAVLRGEAEPETTRVHDGDFYATHDIELLTGRTVEALDPDARQVRLDGDDAVPFTTAVWRPAPRRDDSTSPDPTSTVSTTCARRRFAPARRRHPRRRPRGGDRRRVDRLGGRRVGSTDGRRGRAHRPRPDTPAPRAGRPDRRGVPSPARRPWRASCGCAPASPSCAAPTPVEQVVLERRRRRGRRCRRHRRRRHPPGRAGRRAGLKVDNGIVVDEHLQSSVPGVYAAGDVASAWHPHYGQHLRVEHWANALNQGLAAGANAAGGTEPYTRLPYFFSDQYDLGMEYVGYSDPADAVVVRGSLADREFIAFWHRDGIVTAAMNVNVWDVVEDLKAIVAGGRHVEPGRLADPAVALADLA